MLHPLYTAAEMREAEAGHDIDAMMERAGRAVADAALRRFPSARRFACVCGGGSNGGDGRIAARLLRAAGRDAEETRDVDGADVVVDALFGTGFHGGPRPDAAALIEAVNGCGAAVLAVDVPSGVDASTGEVAGPAVRATATVTMHAPKVGLHVSPGRVYAGEVEIADIGIEHVRTRHRLLAREVLAKVPRRRPEHNKYSAGAVVVVGGAPGLTGAACLAAEAAFRADAGYVAVAVPERSLPVVEARLLEAVKVTWDRISEVAGKAGAVAIGPGLGRGEEQRELVRTLLAELEVPVVLDADALDGLEPFARASPTVLTPHDGELARLLGEESAWVRAHRLEAVARAVERFDAIVLLKGPDTLIAAPGEGVLVRSADVPGLATAGTGDVLTGVVAAFAAKGMEPRLAAAAAAVAHAEAALRAPQQVGLVASDVVELLPLVLAG